MKILFITRSINTIGSIQRAICSIANNLSYEISILTDDDLSVDELYKLKGNIIKHSFKQLCPSFYKKNIFKRIICKLNRKYRFLNNNLFEKMNKYFHYNSKNVNFLERFISTNYDIVIATSDLSMYLSMCKVDVIKIGWLNSSYDGCFNTKGFYFYGEALLCKKLLMNLNEVIVLNEKDKIKLDEFGVSCTVITYPKSFYSKEKSKLNNKNFIAVGRITKYKGYDLLIKAFNIFLNQNNEYTLTIIGSGNDKKYKKLIARYSLEGIVEIKSTNNVKEEFLNSCGLIMSSFLEGFSLLMIESFELGVPIIAYDMDSTHDVIIDGYNGMKCKYINEYHLAKTLDDYVNLDYKKMNKNCVKTSKNYEVKIIIEKWNEMINTVTTR